MERPEEMTRRRLLGRGARLAYVTPLIIAAAQAKPAFAVSGAVSVSNDDKSGRKRPLGRPERGR